MLIKIFIKKIYDYIFFNDEVIRKNWVVNQLADLQEGSKILDAGAGELQYQPYCSHLNYVSQDFGEYDGVGNDEGLQTGTRDNTKIDIISDIINIPVKNNEFDHILCIEVLEHLPNPTEAIYEFSRILNIGGTLILTAPFSSLTHYAPFYFYNGFSKYYYLKILDNCGFLIEKMEMNGNYFDYLLAEIGRIPRIIKRYTKLYLIIWPWYYLLALPIIVILKLASKFDLGSNELLTTGIFIKAVKIQS